MTKKWYEFIISVEPSQAEGNEDQKTVGQGAVASQGAAQAVADIAASIATETTFKSPVHGPASFEEIYRAAEISPAAHGYTILKIADMLQSEHIRSLPAEVKRSSILLALEAAGVKLTEVIEDAIRRDRALDTYERVLQKSVEDLEARTKEENRKVEEELERLMTEYRTRLQANNDGLTKEKELFFNWRLQKQQEEKRIADAVSHFVSENPVTLGGGSAPSSPKPA